MNPSTYSTEKKKGGSYVLSAADLTALSTCVTVSDVLDVCSAVTKAQHVVAPNQIGKATTTEV